MVYLCKGSIVRTQCSTHDILLHHLHHEIHRTLFPSRIYYVVAQVGSDESWVQGVGSDGRVSLPEATGELIGEEDVGEFTLAVCSTTQNTKQLHAISHTHIRQEIYACCATHKHTIIHTLLTKSCNPYRDLKYQIGCPPLVLSCVQSC
jgi:hypothetical protein